MHTNTLRRRTFLALLGGVPLWALADQFTSPSAAQTTDRKKWWAPNTSQTLAIEWRYVAGRITNSTEDYGFIVSFSDSKYPQKKQELLVQRQDLKGTDGFVGKVYLGSLTYASKTATYTFTGADPQAHGTIQWDETAQVYRMSLITLELTLEDIVMTPQGTLIPEGGTGIINVGRVSGINVASDYHADWTQMLLNNMPVGTARVDMQGLRATGFTSGLADTGSGDYDHHWFAVAGELDDGTPVWISAWRLESQGTLNWDVTIAQGNGSSWQVASFTEKSGLPAPLTVQVLDFQPLPQATGLRNASTGTRWHFAADLGTAGNIDLELSVPPGQFITGTRLGDAAGISVMEEGVGTQASGTIFGKTLRNVTLAVGESTAEYYLEQLPTVQKSF